VAPGGGSTTGQDVAVPADPPPTEPARRPGGRVVAVLPWVLAVLALVPLVASVVEVAPGWLPVGDDATIEMRGRDLLTEETPLLGMPSAVGEQTGRPVHHPGPLELWWVGAWVRALGIDQASLLAAATAWGAAVVAALVLARRVGGTALLALAGVLAAALTWSLRGEVPVTPFNVHAIVVPLGAYVLALVAWHQRVRWAGLASIVLGSWAAQAHLTAVGPVLAAGGVVAGAALLRRLRAPVATGIRARGFVLGAAALAALWIGPLVDVVANGGGNVRAVLDARSDLASEVIGLGTATDIVVRAVSLRPVFAAAGAHPSRLVVEAGAAQHLAAGAVVLLAVVGSIRRRRTHPALGIATAATLAATVTGAVLAARFPNDYLSLLALHNHLWLWPLATLLWGAAAVAIALEVRDVLPSGWRARALPVGGALAVVVLVVLAVASVGPPHRNLTLATPAYVRALGDAALDRLDPSATYRVRISGEFDRFFAEVGLLAHLEDEGLDVVGPERYRRAFGDRRVTPDGPVAGDLVVDLAWDVDDLAGDGVLLGDHRPADDLLERRRRVEDALVALLRRHPDELPLWDMDGTGDAEVRRWLREDLDALRLARLVPDWLDRADETDRYLDLWREPVLHASLRLVPTEGS